MAFSRIANIDLCANTVKLSKADLKIHRCIIFIIIVIILGIIIIILGIIIIIIIGIIIIIIIIIALGQGVKTGAGRD